MRVIHFPEEIIFSATKQKCRILMKKFKNSETRENLEKHHLYIKKLLLRTAVKRKHV